MAVLQRSRLLAVVLIVFTFVGTTGSWHVADDPDCYSGIVLHDHSAHHARVGTPTAATTPTHCAICHWLQTFRIDGARQTRVPFAADSYARFTESVHSPALSVATISIAPRAPPIA